MGTINSNIIRDEANTKKLLVAYFQSKKNFGLYPFSIKLFDADECAKYIFSKIESLYRLGYDPISPSKFDEILDSDVIMKDKVNEKKKERIKTYFNDIRKIYDKKIPIEESELKVILDTERKYGVLRALNDAGDDIEEFFADPESKDEAAKKAALDNFEKHTASELLEKYASKKENNLSAIKDAMGIRDIFETVRAEDLEGIDDEISYLIEDIIEHGTLNVLYGPAKVGTTTLALQMAFCIQNGLPFLGKKCLQGNVLYIGPDERPQYLGKHFRALEKHYSSLFPERTEKFVWPFVINNDKEYPIDDFLEAVEKSKENPDQDPICVIFDYYSLFFDGDRCSFDDDKLIKRGKKRSEKSGEILTRNNLRKFMRLTDDNTTIIYLHTTVMGDAGTKPVIYGSDVHNRITSSIMGLYRDEQLRWDYRHRKWVVVPDPSPHGCPNFLLELTGRSIEERIIYLKRDATTDEVFGIREKSPE